MDVFPVLNTFIFHLGVKKWICFPAGSKKSTFWPASRKKEFFFENGGKDDDGCR